jgi:hypothetical protein
VHKSTDQEKKQKKKWVWYQAFFLIKLNVMEPKTLESKININFIYNKNNKNNNLTTCHTYLATTSPPKFPNFKNPKTKKACNAQIDKI